MGYDLILILAIVMSLLNTKCWKNAALYQVKFLMQHKNTQYQVKMKHKNIGALCQHTSHQAGSAASNGNDYQKSIAQYFSVSYA